MVDNSIICEFYSYEEAVNKSTGQIYGVLKVLFCDKIVKMFTQNQNVGIKLKDVKRLQAIILHVEIKATSEDSRFALVPFDVDVK